MSRRRSCRRCGWPKGSNGCRQSHLLNPRVRMWSRREWERHRDTGKLRWWDTSSRRDRRREAGR
jgi:hypothetical protein